MSTHTYTPACPECGSTVVDPLATVNRHLAPRHAGIIAQCDGGHRYAVRVTIGTSAEVTVETILLAVSPSAAEARGQS